MALCLSGTIPHQVHCGAVPDMHITTVTRVCRFLSRQTFVVLLWEDLFYTQSSRSGEGSKHFCKAVVSRFGSTMLGRVGAIVVGFGSFDAVSIVVSNLFCHLFLYRHLTTKMREQPASAKKQICWDSSNHFSTCSLS